jgi:phosphopantothenoylcysteine decarboxylase/phosphopantothenate--cysteine ligase
MALADLKGKRIVLGVTGGIAAYKAVEVCRQLCDLGAHVSPVMTEGAKKFIGETTLSALASEPVQTKLWNAENPIPHTKLGQQADLIVVAPATARLIGTYAAGISNDLLTATLLATRAPVVICPAMHTEMWEHPAVQENIATLRRRGVIVVEPEAGRLAGGDLGQGRLAAPTTIVASVMETLTPADLAGVKVVVTAGGTREPIDSVRVISNRSSGKQGHAVAAAAIQRGASVSLITTVDLPAPVGVELVRVETTAQMQDALNARASAADVVIMAAAVADFRPVQSAESKLKKSAGIPKVELEPTPDLLAELGQNKPTGMTLVGFAAETENLEVNASDKLVRKNLDLIVANDVSAPNVGFAYDTNSVLILGRNGERKAVELAPKASVAHAILDSVVAHRAAR